MLLNSRFSILNFMNLAHCRTLHFGQNLEKKMAMLVQIAASAAAELAEVFEAALVSASVRWQVFCFLIPHLISCTMSHDVAS